VIRRASFALLCAALVGLAALSTTAEGRKACKPGVHTFSGSTKARTFCGPARATLVVGGTTFKFKGGNCQRGKKYLTINIGTVVLGSTSKPRPEYFGITVGKTQAGGTPAPKDGTYDDAVIAVVHKHKGYSIGNSSVTLQGGRTKGTLTGQLAGSGDAVTGSFRCK
jgi:hypothetical protein